MRFEVTKRFSEWLELETPDLSKIALIGGTSQDPEIKVLKERYPDLEICYFGIENPVNDKDFHYLDLNSGETSERSLFDLVICSQVIEHLWNLDQAFTSLQEYIKDNGYLWLNCPASNMAHGSPEYYSAGYSASYIARNLEFRGFSIQKCSNFGSRRYYFMTHILRTWVTEREHMHPILGYKVQPGSKLGILRKYLVEIPGRFVSLFFSKKIEEDINYATESVVLAKLTKF